MGQSFLGDRTRELLNVIECAVSRRVSGVWRRGYLIRVDGGVWRAHYEAAVDAAGGVPVGKEERHAVEDVERFTEEDEMAESAFDLTAYAVEELVAAAEIALKNLVWLGVSIHLGKTDFLLRVPKAMEAHASDRDAIHSIGTNLHERHASMIVERHKIGQSDAIQREIATIHVVVGRPIDEKLGSFHHVRLDRVRIQTMLVEKMSETVVDQLELVARLERGRGRRRGVKSTCQGQPHLCNLLHQPVAARTVATAAVAMRERPLRMPARSRHRGVIVSNWFQTGFRNGRNA